ncbi:MAG: response regulator [Candidatus Dadabacteria bacterium]|nr:MAG: response regulator [Candidatus Dadabacteria bacterium]
MNNDTPAQFTVLIADDDADTRIIVSSAIQQLKCKVLEAEDGKKALESYREHSPDLAILDVMMPEMNGNEVCREIKKSQEGTLVPVIMLTAKDQVKDIVDSLEGGADDYLTKPFHYQELQARVKAQLRVRELNLSLRDKNIKLEAMQQKLIEQERQLAVGQLAGTAAHKLGQPLSAIILNCHLLGTLKEDDPRFKQALAAIENDAKRMAKLIEKLKAADAAKKEEYYRGTDILDIDDE